ncbi:MAG: acyltransferase [Solirubrobacterales bacterium]
MAATGTFGADTPDVVAPPPHHPRFPLTVGLRGIAAITIIVGHAWFFTGGFGGFTTSLPNRIVVRWDGVVAVFFMLSAFLLYRPMIAHRTGGPVAPRTGDYARRRFLRLFPAYWVALTALAIFPGLFGVFSHNWWAFYSLTDFLDVNHLHSVCPPSEEFRCGLPQSWTLGIDLTFYVMLPFYALASALLFRLARARRWVAWELGLLTVLAVASMALGGSPFDLRDQAWFRYSFAGYFYWFALGMALAVLSVSYARRGHQPRVLQLVASRPGLCWAGGFAVYLTTVLIFSDAPFVFAFNSTEYFALNLIQGIGATLFFLPAVFGNPNRGLPARVLGHPFLMWTGLISYGLLLWHGTVAVMLGSLFGSGEGYWTVLIAEIVVAVPLATVSYYLVERPLMKFKYRPFGPVIRNRFRRATMRDAGEPG